MLVFLFLPILAVGEDEEVHSLPWEDYLIYSLLALLCVLFAGLMSGLTVGLMSIDELYLEMKMLNGTDLEKKRVKKLLPVLNNHHFLLVTLLLANSTAMEALPLMLDKMFGNIIAILLSVTFVLVFGEIVPMAVCTGPDQLKIANFALPIVRVVMVIFFVISYPISKLLDKCFGHDEGPKLFKNEDLKALFQMYEKSKTDTRLGQEQIRIIHGTIDLQSEKVGDHMVGVSEIVSVGENDVITKEYLKKLGDSGISRVPVFDESCRNVTGILKLRFLLGVKENVMIKDLGISLVDPVFVEPDMSVLQLLGVLKTRMMHIALVVNTTGDLIGVITIEDIMNNLIPSSQRRSQMVSRLSLRLSKNKMVGKRQVRIKDLDYSEVPSYELY